MAGYTDPFLFITYYLNVQFLEIDFPSNNSLGVESKRALGTSLHNKLITTYTRYGNIYSEAFSSFRDMHLEDKAGDTRISLNKTWLGHPGLETAV